MLRSKTETTGALGVILMDRFRIAAAVMLTQPVHVPARFSGKAVTNLAREVVYA